ncbi:hypothetical protein ACX6XY_08440 [Streptomyces sp. O3]
MVSSVLGVIWRALRAPTPLAPVPPVPPPYSVPPAVPPGASSAARPPLVPSVARPAAPLPAVTESEPAQ